MSGRSAGVRGVACTKGGPIASSSPSAACARAAIKSSSGQPALTDQLDGRIDPGKAANDLGHRGSTRAQAGRPSAHQSIRSTPWNDLSTQHRVAMGTDDG